MLIDHLVEDLKHDVGEEKCKGVMQELTKVLYLEQETSRLKIKHSIRKCSYGLACA